MGLAPPEVIFAAAHRPLPHEGGGRPRTAGDGSVETRKPPPEAASFPQHPAPSPGEGAGGDNRRAGCRPLSFPQSKWTASLRKASLSAEGVPPPAHLVSNILRGLPPVHGISGMTGGQDPCGAAAGRSPRRMSTPLQSGRPSFPLSGEGGAKRQRLRGLAKGPLAGRGEPKSGSWPGFLKLASLRSHGRAQPAPNATPLQSGRPSSPPSGEGGAKRQRLHGLAKGPSGGEGVSQSPVPGRVSSNFPPCGSGRGFTPGWQRRPPPLPQKTGTAFSRWPEGRGSAPSPEGGASPSPGRTLGDEAVVCRTAWRFALAGADAGLENCAGAALPWTRSHRGRKTRIAFSDPPAPRKQSARRFPAGRVTASRPELSDQAFSSSKASWSA